jgi:hypothetical protein
MSTSHSIGNVNVHSNHTGKNEHLDCSDDACNGDVKQNTQYVLNDGSKSSTSFSVKEIGVERNCRIL